MSAPSELDAVRDELRRLGYLSHRLDRFLLQDGLRPRGALGAWLRLAGKVGLTLGAGAALLGVLGLAFANGGLTASPSDLPLLFLHLLVPLSLAAAGVFLVLAAVLAGALRWLPVRRFEAVPTALAAAVTAVLSGLALWQSWRVLVGLPRGHAAAALGGGLAVAGGLAWLLDRALLALAIGLTRHAPAGPRLSPRRLAISAAVLASVLSIPLLQAARATTPPPVGSLPEAAGDRVLLVGLDGVLSGELDYLLGRGELPELARLGSESGGWRAYRHRSPSPGVISEPVEVPATFWTGVATGVGPSLHGVVALDSVAPLGVAAPLARLGPTRALWTVWSVPLHLAEVKPLLAGRRRAATLWELASRGGAPIAAINWWATFPADPLPGLVVAHGARQLLEEGASGAVAPTGRRDEVAALARNAAADPASLTALAALTADERTRLTAVALAPDAFYRSLFATELERGPRVAALYLPGIDIAAEGWQGGPLAFGDLLRAELAAFDHLLAGAHGYDTVAVIVDPGRRANGGEGRVLLWRRVGCAAPRSDPGAPVEIARVSSALFRAAGLAQSAELPEPVAGCIWPEAPARVATYGVRSAEGGSNEADAEYLKSLRSLGYL